MRASLHGTERVRRGMVLVAVAAIVGTTTTLLACYSAGTDDEVEPLPTSSVYVPAEAGNLNPAPPGVTPRKPADDNDPPPPPKDSGSTQPPSDGGGTQPKPDSGTTDAG